MPYWRLDAKCPYILCFSPCGVNSEVLVLDVLVNRFQQARLLWRTLIMPILFFRSLLFWVGKLQLAHNRRKHSVSLCPHNYANLQETADNELQTFLTFYTGYCWRMSKKYEPSRKSLSKTFPSLKHGFVIVFKTGLLQCDMYKI